MQHRQLGWGLTIVFITAAIVAAIAVFGKSTPTVGAQTTGNPQAEYERVNPAFLAAILPCQVGVTAAQRALEAGDRYQAYDVVQGAQQACVNAWEGLNTVSYGEAMPQPYRDQLNADVRRCATAYSQHRAALDEVATILNGDTRPSTTSQTIFDIRRATAEVSACLTMYKDDLRAAGVKLPAEVKAQAPAHGRRHRRAAVSTASADR